MANVQLKDNKGNPIYPVIGRLGETWISIDGIVPAGGLPYDGRILKISDYKSLWDWVVANHKWCSESEWNSRAVNTDYFMYAKMNDGVSFKLPKVTHYLKAGGGPNLPEKLPNITGGTGDPGSNSTTAGVDAQYSKEWGAIDTTASDGWGSDPAGQYSILGAINFNASKTPGTGRGVYEEGAHVQPMTNGILLGVYYMDVASGVGTSDITQFENRITQAHEILDSGYKKGANESFDAFVKFSDGTQICYGHLDELAATKNWYKWSDWWEADYEIYHNYLSSFEGKPALIVSQGTSFAMACVLATTTSTRIQEVWFVRPNQLETCTIRVFYIAIGRWK